MVGRGPNEELSVETSAAPVGVVSSIVTSRP